MLGANKVKKPIKRSKARKYLGKRYFIVKRRIKWLLDKKKFAKEQQPVLLEHAVFEHSSILLRPLKNVDMEYQHNKITNLRLAIEKMDRVVLKPGETFSLWYLVGSPTARKGYLKGLVLNNGKIGYDYGGGLCQLGNLLYWMVLHSPLKVTERWRHSFDVFPDVNRKLPFGSGATLSYNYIDLQFKNETSNTFQLNLWLSKERLHGSLLSDQSLDLSYEVYEDYHRFQQEMWGGYTRHNMLRRKTYNKTSKQEITDDIITENHAIMMYSPLVEAKNEES